MKRYISISISLLMVSLLNMLTWLCLGFSMGNTKLSNVFSLMYPIWFLVGILLSVFGTGANVRKNKKNEKTNDTVFSGMIWGILFGVAIFVILAIFSGGYVEFMHMDVKTFGNFARFSMLQALAWLIFQLVLEKLYFEDKDTEANIHGVLFYVLSFVGLVVCSFITKDERIITGVTLGLVYAYTIVLFCLKIKKFRFKWDFYKNIRYESVSLFSNLLFFITYFIGYSNAFEAGEKYIIAINLVNLVTDPQWDALDAVAKIAKIDLSRGDFNFKSAIKKSTILTLSYVASSVILFFALFKAYNATLWIGVICLAMQVADMILDIFIRNLRCFLQLEYSPYLITFLNLTIMVFRAIFSVFVLSPFNTNIAQVSFDALALVVWIGIARHLFRLGKNGFFVAKKKKIKIDKIVLYVDRRFQIEKEC